MDLPYHDTPAATLLREAIDTARRDGRRVADELGLKPNILGMYARGDAALPVDLMVPVARVLGLDPAMMLERCKESYPGSPAWRSAVIPGERSLSRPERDLLAIRLDAADAIAPALRKVDMADAGAWRTVVDAAIGAGLDEGAIVRGLGCRRDDIHAWRSGRATPEPGGLPRMRDALADLIEDWAAGTRALLA